jgi:hypothetical protein
MKLPVYAFAATAIAFAPLAQANQPNMEAALASLQQARASLEKAVADKGGHRAKAMKLVDDAIVEVKKGIEFAKKH